MEQQQLCLWLVTSQTVEIDLHLYTPGQQRAWFARSLSPDATEWQQIPIGQRAFIHCIDVTLNDGFSEGQWVEYDLHLSVNGNQHGLAELIPSLLYPGQQRPSFVFKKQLDQVLHGSCRKPHYPSGDGLLQVDQQLAGHLEQPQQRPALLMMSGDQIYADDVSGPMLDAIHQVIEALGLYDERWSGATLNSSADLFASEHSYYQREDLLPHTKANRDLYERFFAGARKPIFTTQAAHNHLITLAEVLAMYLLVWSPTPWRLVRLGKASISDCHRDKYQQEVPVIEQFAAGLPQVQRAMAHLPVYMIFDDHDITDDWNLTRGWEEAAYGHPFSRRIIGNALIGYLLCQGWGNDPKGCQPLMQQLPQHFDTDGIQQQDPLIDQLLNWGQWHYQLPTTPKLVVMDTRTHRWRSEHSPSQPSGLMDWEALSELQQELLNQEAVIMVSPAPIYGVKFIETVQRVFAFFGQALLVDAENWMAHPGAANVILNIFSHPKTPQHFIILSGDVHYSFVYDIRLRFRSNSPLITQITCSGIKNEFPASLLNWFDKINRWLYARYSPLNWLTKRRRMSIRARYPETQAKRPLLNQSGIGVLSIKTEKDNLQVKTSVITAQGQAVSLE